jgi:hypothetical protein
MSEPLGPVTHTQRGFELLEFADSYGVRCSLQESSVMPHLWLGVEDADPQVLATQAANIGVATTATNGWVPYPIPEEVLLKTRMHLSREQVAALIRHLEAWLETDSFDLPSS